MGKSKELIEGGKQQQIEHALNNIASAFGTDGQHLLELKDKLKGDFLSIARDPTGKFKQMITTVLKLLSGSEREKGEARQAIREMPSKTMTRASEDDTRMIEDGAMMRIYEHGLQKP